MDAREFPAAAHPTLRLKDGAARPIRALFVLLSLEGGGAQRVTLNLLRLLNRESIAPSLILFRREGELMSEVPAGVPLLTINESGHQPGLFRIIRDLVVRARKADIIVAALQCRTTYICWLAGALAVRPVIGWVHSAAVVGSPMAQPSHRALMRLVHPRLAASVFTCERAYQSVARQVPLGGAAVRIIPNFIDHDLVCRLSSADRPPAPKHNRSSTTLIAVGRLAPSKGYDILVRALHQLHQKGHRCQLIILGRGPERDNLTLLVSQLGLSDFVKMPGFAANPYALMRQADIFVLASHYEGMPLTLMEARALRMPIVATDCMAGPREILENGRHGTLVPVGDPAAIASAIANLIERPRDGSCWNAPREHESVEDNTLRSVAAWEQLLRDAARRSAQRSVVAQCGRDPI
jgi:glycosyltransferase involved in cell wall biosynthesis